MPGPFYNAIKGTTSGAPGTGAFTPNAASAGFRNWSIFVPTGWVGLVRYEDGSDWELSYSYWNGTTLSRGTNQLVASSTGLLLTLTSAATAAMIADGNEIGPDFSSYPARGYVANGATPLNLGMAGAATITGSGSSPVLAASNYLQRQMRHTETSAITVNAQGGMSTTQIVAVTSSTSGVGGWQFNCRFGASSLPTGPRLFVGMTGTTYVSSTAEPSAVTANYAILGKDSTDINLQIITNSNAGSGTKIDTGLALAANGWYEITLWSEPGSLTIYYLLVRLDTGAIFYGSTATDVPVADVGIFPQVLGGLNGTNAGTAFAMNIGHMLTRQVV